MTSSEPSSREGPNQFQPLTDASPGSAQPPGRRVPRPLRRRPTTAFALSFERKASPFFAKALFEFTKPAIHRRRKFEPKMLIFDGEDPKFTTASPRASGFESPQLHQEVRANRRDFPRSRIPRPEGVKSRPANRRGFRVDRNPRNSGQ